MTSKEINILPLFKEFIRQSKSGKRTRADGKKISGGSVANYNNLQRLLTAYEAKYKAPIRLKPANRLTKKQLLAERNYWRKFHKQFTDEMYRDGGLDNYVGGAVKILRTFFGWIEKEKLLNTGGFHKQFTIAKEDIPIVTLMPKQLQRMIHDKAFEASLPLHLKRTKDIFVTGCTVALRFGDLTAIRYRDIVEVAGNHYLCVKSGKTETVTRVRLPGYAVSIIGRQKKKGKIALGKPVFAPISLNQFNGNLRKLCELAGFTEEVGKVRSRRGKQEEIPNAKTGKPYRFCELVSSHTMRRTAITTMLMHGVPELVVKKISGHSANSPAFHKYVNLVQSYLDEEVGKHHEKMGMGMGMGMGG